MIRRFLAALAFPLALLVPVTVCAQQPQLGTISGQVRVAQGESPTGSIMVELHLRGATVSSVYTDTQGYFSFSNLEPNLYHLVISDDAYYPVEERAVINPEAPNTVVHIILRLREDRKTDDETGKQPAGSNPYLVDPADYSKRFPKKALKEYERGLAAERKGNHEEAIAHYEGALKIAPDYYPAHNNLGALYLGKSDFKPAEEHFRETVRLDHNDAQAYFNLSNVLLLTRRYQEAAAMLSAGLQRRPDSAFARFLQGSLFARTGKAADAEKSLREALQLDPSMSQARLQLVNLYLQQDRKPDAIRQLQEFLRVSPGAPLAAKAREVLHRLQEETDAVHR